MTWGPPSGVAGTAAGTERDVAACLSPPRRDAPANRVLPHELPASLRDAGLEQLDP